VAGSNGCDDQVGAGTFTPSGKDDDKKIHGIGILADAEITSIIVTNKHGVDETIDDKSWMGVTLASADTVNSFIPLGYDAKSVVVASGTVRNYFK